MGSKTEDHDKQTGLGFKRKHFTLSVLCVAARSPLHGSTENRSKTKTLVSFASRVQVATSCISVIFLRNAKPGQTKIQLAQQGRRL